MTFKTFFRRNKQCTPSIETVNIVTMEDLFTFFSNSQQRIKRKRKASSHFDFDISAHDGDDTDDDAKGGVEDESIVRVLGSDCRSES